MAVRRRALWLRAAGAFAVLLAIPLVLSHFVRSTLYPVPPVRVPSPPPTPLEEVALTLDSRPLAAWWLAPPQATSPVVLMLHGNGENLETLRWSGLYQRFAELGTGVLAIDYPGYGRSAGAPSEAALLAAAAEGWRELQRRAGAERPRIVAGWSLGAAVAAQLAAQEAGSVDALILMSAWTRLDEVARLHFPAWLVGPLLRDRYDSLSALATVRCPALLLHGTGDNLIPAENGRRLFEALREPKWRVEVEGAGHNDLLGRAESWQAIAELLRRARRGG